MHLVAFSEALYASHGFSALVKDKIEGRDASVATFPCNSAVLQGSLGCDCPLQPCDCAGAKWYGDGVTRSDASGSLSSPCSGSGRTQSSAPALGAAGDAFVVCSFGLVTPAKLSYRLLEAWLASPLAQEEACCLIFVGENDGGRLWQPAPGQDRR